MDFDNQTGSDDIIPMLWKLEENGSVRPDYQPGSMTAMWQTYPASISSSIVNLNIESYPPMIRPKQVADQARRAVLTDLSIGGERDGTDIPSTTVIQPIFRDFEDNADIVGYLFVSIRWDVFFKGILSGETLPIISIITSPCGRTLAFEINGGDVKFDGYEDHHEHDLDDFEIKSLFAEAAIYYPEDKDRNVTHISCPYELHIFPTSKMKNKYCTNLPLYFTFGAVAVFIVTSFAFILYDALVTRRQLKVATTAKLSNQIVQDLFPKEFQDRLFGGDGHEDGAFMKKTAIKMDPKQHSYQGEQKRRHSISFHDDAEMNGPAIYDAAPVANLFPNCTGRFFNSFARYLWQWRPRTNTILHSIFNLSSRM